MLEWLIGDVGVFWAGTLTGCVCQFYWFLWARRRGRLPMLMVSDEEACTCRRACG